MIDTIMLPFTYLLVHKRTGKLYYGVRCSRGCHPSDLWTKYFSSSKIVKAIIREEGLDAFSYEIRKTFDTREDALRWEHRFLTRVNAAESDRWLNKFNGGKKFTCEGHSVETRQKISRSLKGKPKSEEWKKKASLSASWAGKVTEKQRQAGADKLRGRSRPRDVVERMRKSKTGKKRFYLPDGSFIMIDPQHDQYVSVDGSQLTGVSTGISISGPSGFM